MNNIDTLIELGTSLGVVVCFLLGAILGHSWVGGNRRV